MNNTPLGVLVTENTVSMILNGKPLSINSSHRNFTTIKEKVLKKDYEGLMTLVDTETVLKQHIEKTNNNALVIANGVVMYNGTPIHNVLSEKLLKDFDAGYHIKAFSNFVENLMQNPSNTAINELYLFIEKANLPLTEDGCFLAYKKVRYDYKDIYTGTIDNSVGSIVTMPRNQVDDSRNNTCSHGLHFCSFDYLSNFGSGSGDKVVVLKINPMDVVSIPSDYDNTKGRTCKYEVIAEIESDKEDLLDGSSGNSWLDDDFDTDETTFESEKSDVVYENKIYTNKKQFSFSGIGSVTIMENGAVMFRNETNQFISKKRAEEIGLIEEMKKIGHFINF